MCIWMLCNKIDALFVRLCCLSVASQNCAKT